jgi:PQQ enzyme-like repeat protein
MAVEDCNIYRAGRGSYVPLVDPANPPEKYLRAVDMETGKIAWEVRQTGAPEANYSGVLSTGQPGFLRRDGRELCRCRRQDRPNAVAF